MLATTYAGEPKPVCFEVSEGEAGIPVFVIVEGAEAFAEAYRETLGSSVEALELSDNDMAQLLRRRVDETEYVSLNPRPVWASSGTVWWEMIDIRQFARGLCESDP